MTWDGCLFLQKKGKYYFCKIITRTHTDEVDIKSNTSSLDPQKQVYKIDI